jgi:hypothetical protein
MHTVAVTMQFATLAEALDYVERLPAEVRAATAAYAAGDDAAGEVIRVEPTPDEPYA